MRKELIKIRDLNLLLIVSILVFNLFFVSAGSVNRIFDSSVLKGRVLNVNLTVAVNSSDNFYIIEEFIPSEDWSFVYFGGGNVNLSANSRRIVFFNYTNSSDPLINTIINYGIRAPNSIGSFSFGGNYTIGNNVSRVIAGSTSVQAVECLSNGDCNGNDGVSCTVNTCLNNVCVNASNDSFCSNGLFCDGVESCNPSLPGTGCQAGTPIICQPDSFTCTENTCNEVGLCSSPFLNNSRCNSGEICSPTNFPATGCGSANNCTDLDNDGLFDYNTTTCSTGKDYCPYTNDTYFVNNLGQSDNYIPRNGSLNISVVNGTNLLGYDNFSIELNGVGKIIFKQRVKLYRINETGCFERLDFNLTNFVNIQDKKIFINSSYFGEFANKQARLQFSNIGFTDPKILRNGADCSLCNEISYSSGIFVVDVSGFSNYEVVEGYSAPSQQPGGGPSGPSGSSGPTTSQCRDGKDNDNDRKIDYPNDTGCVSLTDNSELDISEINITQGALCIPSWECGEYGECLNEKKIKTCADKNNCNVTNGYPTDAQVECEGLQLPEKINISKIILITILSVIILSIIVAMTLLMIKRRRDKKLNNQMLSSLKINNFVIGLVLILILVLFAFGFSSSDKTPLYSPSLLAGPGFLTFLLLSAVFSFIMWIIVMKRNVGEKAKEEDIKKSIGKRRKKRK